METVSTVEQQNGKKIQEETITGIIKAITNNFSPERIIIFGSYASNQLFADSDLDLVIIMDTGLPYHKRATPIRLLFRPTPCAMDIFVYTPEEVAKWNGATNHIITEAFRNGRIVYEKRPRVGTAMAEESK